MANYHSWCPTENRQDRICGMRGVRMRSPTLRLAALLGPSSIADADADAAPAAPAAPFVSAVVHATALGMFELSINGARVGDAVLEPGFSTNMTERLLYATYDVTDHLVAALAASDDGAVMIAAKVGGGKHSLGFDPAQFGLLAELHVVLADGTNVTITTTKDWTMSNSPIAYENLYQGETFDARLEQPGWELPASATAATATTEGWAPVSVVSGPPGALAASLMPPVRVVELITPVKAWSSGPTSVIVDLGKNIAGWVLLAIPAGAAAGTTVKMEFGEVVTDGHVNNPFTQTDSYVFSGKEAGGDWHSPSFVYHGFRFVEITGHPGNCTDSAGAGCIKGQFAHSDVEATGHLEFPATAGAKRTDAAAVLDDIHKAVLQTQLSNLVSIPTDCPQREKRGWMGDAQWTAEEASLNFDMSALYVNWVRSMLELQETGCIPTTEQFKLEPPFGTCCSPTTDPLHPSIFQCSPYSNSSDTAGSVPDIVPSLWGNGGSRGWPGAPVWSSAIVIIPDVLRSRYSDVGFLKEAYPGIKAHVAFLKRQAKFAPGKVLPQFGLLGDWLSLDPFCPGGNDKCLTSPGWVSGNPTTAFQYLLDVQAMAAVAELIGNAADAAAFQKEYALASASYHDVFFNASTGAYGEQQTANAMPLAAKDVIPAGDVAGVADRLVGNVAKFPNASYGGHVSVGGVGSRWILAAMVAANRTADALALATQTSNPSWGYMAQSVPGTFWENWENCVGGSCNHIMLAGGVDPFIYHHVAGIRPPTSAVSLPHGAGVGAVPPRHVGFGVEGVVVEQVRACTASVAVPGGRASISWAWTPSSVAGGGSDDGVEGGGALEYNVTVPFGYSADLTAPKAVGPAALDVEAAGAAGAVDGDGFIGFALGAGTHRVVVSYY